VLPLIRVLPNELSNPTELELVNLMASPTLRLPDSVPPKVDNAPTSVAVIEIFAVPSKDLPAIVLAVANLVAVAARPVQS
jgi:hypothetical protein